MTTTTFQKKTSVFDQQGLEDHITHGCNLIHVIEKYGFSLERSHVIREVAKDVIMGNSFLHKSLNNALLKHKNVVDVFIKHLEKTLVPLHFGISRNWRVTQKELLLATLQTLSRGYVRPLSEVPTGSGKSMHIGALVRAAIDTMRELGLDYEIHILTSRVAIAGQLIEEELPKEEAEDIPLEIGRKGDVRIWIPDISDDKIRVLAGNQSGQKKELAKDSILTISTYQGLRAQRITDQFRKPVFMTICDESHRVTERIAVLLEEMKTLVFGLSATVIGPDRDPFFFFEKIYRPELSEAKQKNDYVGFLNYHKSISEMILYQELKQVRLIKINGVKIDISEAKTKSGHGTYDVLNDDSVARILSKNPTIAAEVVAEAYIGDHPGLRLADSKPIYQRRGIVFVDRINTAKLCAEECNKILAEKIKEKYGKDVHFRAAYVDGRMSEGEYNVVIEKFRKGEITLIFSAEKVGEGIDLPFVNMIILLRPLGLGSQWKLVQNLGRGIRIDKDSPLDDLVILDLVFVSDKHLLASVLGIFGRSTIISGGLIAGWGTAYEIEKKVFELLRKGKSWTEIWNLLNTEERRAFPFIEQKMYEEQTRSLTGPQSEDNVNVITSNMFRLGEINFIEQEELRLALSLGNKEEMLKYTSEILIKEGFDSIDALMSVRQSSLHSFAKRRFDKFRNGLIMVNLNLNENKTSLTSSNMTSFIELMRRAGLQERRSFHDPRVNKYASTQSGFNQPKKRIENKVIPSKKKIGFGVIEKKTGIGLVGNEFPIETLNFTCRKFFGVEPDITSHPRDLYKQEPKYIAQAHLELPEGLKYSSPIVSSVSKEVAEKAAAVEFQKIIDAKMVSGEITVYVGSKRFNNLLKALELMVYENQYQEVIYTITERNNLSVVVAYVEKFKGIKFSGKPAFHQNVDEAKKFARVTLALQLTYSLPSFSRCADTNVSKKPMAMLENLCEKARFGEIKKSTTEVKHKNNVLYKGRIKVLGWETSALGITPEHAIQRAAGLAYEELSQHVGGQAIN